jgi:hypothetical protein
MALNFFRGALGLHYCLISMNNYSILLLQNGFIFLLLHFFQILSLGPIINWNYEPVCLIHVIFTVIAALILICYEYRYK